jgi:sugar lactone lactonase YvrE
LFTAIAATVTATAPLGAQQPSPSAGQASVRDVYELHNRAAAAARSAGDWATVRRHASAVDTLFNGNPATLMAIARASAKLGDTAHALATVRTVMSMGVVRNLDAEQDLTALRALPDWTGIATANEQNARSIGSTRALFAMPAIDFLAEDIVWDAPRERFLVSSVRKGTVVAVKRDGTSSAFISGKQAGIWGVFALGIDWARSRLWATTVAMPHFEGYAAQDSAKSSVVRFNLLTGALEKRYDLPPTRRGNSPGDIAVDANGRVYVSDSRSGVVYAIDPDVDSLAVLVPEGTFMSPQGPAVSADGRKLYVADYVRGLAEVDLGTRSVRWLRHARNIALSGIDGLTVVDSGRLIALQNGLMPHRVMALTFDPGAGAITSATILAQDTALIREPTHGLMVGDEFLFIANSGWDGFDDKGVPQKDGKLTPPAVLGVRVRF